MIKGDIITRISSDFSEYKEGIFVGYRHFETYAKDKVLYPFGFGLSYTDFEFDALETKIEDNTVNIKVTVKNIGAVVGKEVIQLYYNAPKGRIEKPYLQLCAYEKTRPLNPNESETIMLSLKIADMASFDEDICSYVLEKGEYKLFIGNSVRNIKEAGSYTLDEEEITQKLSRQVTAKATEDDMGVTYEDAGIDKGVSLYDVSEDRNIIEEFVRQLTVEELIHLAQGQDSDFAMGTGGIGNLRNYKIPNPQTADGPAGLRKAVPTTYFPCATMLASTYDKEQIYEVGKAMGYEGIATGVDILLAPGLNIRRNPLCGRNFEYYSEDPYVTGKTAAAMVKGVQSEGLCATIKHFFANKCETNRNENNSIMSERTAREIYLKGFEFAVKEAEPVFVMSSYNLVNGVRSSATHNILRKEWGFKGAVMTDWRTNSHLWEKIKAGNNIKMSYGHPEDAQLALDKYNDDILKRYELKKML